MADLRQALDFALVALLDCGLGFIAGARRLETAFFAGWGLACIGFVAAGCLLGSSLAPVAAVLGVLGIVGCAVAIRRWPASTDAMARRVLLLAAPMLLMLLSLRTTAFDDFSFWAPNLLALCATGHFPLAAQPLTASFMPGYPRALALAGYATFLLDPDLSTPGQLRLLATGPWWNILAMLAASTALARILKARLQVSEQLSLWGIAGLGILLQSFLDPGFISKMTLSNMGDGPTASGFAMLAALLFELPVSAKRAPRVTIELALTASAVVFVRQDNSALLFVFGLATGLGLLHWGGPGRWRRVGWLAVAALPACLVALTWTWYTSRQTPGGQHSLLPLNAWHWAYYASTLRSALMVFMSKGLFSLLALGFGAAYVRMLIGGSPRKPADRLVLTAVTGLVFGNIAFILFTYLATSFTPLEVRTAITFWRFLAQTAPAEMVALACLLPVAPVAWLLRRPPAAWAIAIIAASLPIILLPTRYTFRNDLHSPVPAFLAIGQDLAAILPAGAKLALLDNSDGSGYADWIVKFGLVELGGGHAVVTPDFSPQDPSLPRLDPAGLLAGSYVWVSQSPWRPLDPLGVPLVPWHAYLFQRTGSGLSEVAAWPIPPYGRP